MPNDSETGSFSADIPADAIAEAVAAVERNEQAAAAPALEIVPDPPEAEGAERIRELEQQLAAEHERLLRVAADYENYKKRAAREREDVQRFGNERLVKELLPVLDSLDRALAAACARDDVLAKGVEMTRRLFEEALARFGVKSFSAKGEAFDPRIHEALMTIATRSAAPGIVIEEQQRGFFLDDRLLRPAAVVVAAREGSEEGKSNG